MPIRLFTPHRGLMMYAFRRRHVQHFPLPAEAIAEIQILAWRTARKERCKTSNRLERLTPQRTRSSTNPLAWNDRLGCRRKSVWQSSANQTSRLKASHSPVQNHAIHSPKERRRSHRLINDVADRRSYCWIVINRPEKLFGPNRIDLDVVVDQKKMIVRGAFNREVALLRTIPFLVMEVPDVQSGFGPARIVRDLESFFIISAMNDDRFRHLNRLSRETLQTETQQFGPADGGNNR